MLLGAAEFLTLQVRKQLPVRLIDQKVDVRSPLTKELLAIRSAWQGVGVKHEETLLTVLASHGDALHRIANVYAGGDGEDEDLYQEILMQAWKALPSFRGDSSFSTWLYRVALNTALTWRRRSARRQNHRVAMTARMEAIGSPSVSSGPQRSEREILRHFLDSLNGPSRTILVLYMEGLTHEEIAGVTGLSQSAVGVRIHRMKKVFAERYVERST